MNKKIGTTGNEAAALAIKQINPEVIAAYPITPTTQIMETLADYQAKGDYNGEIILVESEHSAVSATVAASFAGARAMTATASQGLALMNEVLHIASGLFTPITMVVGARALSAPINIHNDHSDVMSVLDSGWIQFYAETVQDVYDFIIQAVKISENPKLQIPSMVIMDGFITTHEFTNIEIMSDSKVQKFVGKYQPIDSLLDFENPKTIGGFALPDVYSETKNAQSKRMKKVKSIIKMVANQYQKITDRGFKFLEIDNPKAKKMIVAQASVCGTIREAIKNNSKVGLCKINLFRPFPDQEIINALSDSKEIIVVDRANSFDSIGGPVYKEIRAALFGKSNAKITNHILGLGGKNISILDIKKIIK
jgi:pyruvate ferredoxin oxidoreductase alpha subunit